MDQIQYRVAMVAYLEGALKFAEEIGDTTTAYLIERSLDEARGKLFGSFDPFEEQLQ
jgi:hypothetical protein